MKKILYALSAIAVLLVLSMTASSAAGKKKALVPLADPYILLEGGTYYAYGTHAPDGIAVYTSKNLKTWTPAGLALHKDDVWGEKMFWAPEVYKIGNRYLMYYSCEEHICAAWADSPLGPFKQEVKKPIREEKGIDNSLFIDDDGTPYIFFVRFENANVIWGAELEKDYTTIKENTLVRCCKVSQDWEKIDARVNEGPFVIKHKGLYYMTYSANHTRSQDYAVGCATADSPLGEWKKYDENPIFRRPGNLVGVGHHSLFKDKKGRSRIVFHAHFNNEKMNPRCLYVGNTHFENVNGTDRFRIDDKGIIVPHVKE